MLVDTDNPPESKPDKPAAPHSQLRVRSDLHEEYSSDEIAKMTELYEGTLSNIEEGEIVKSKVLRVTDAAVIVDVVVSRRVLVEAERRANRDVGMKELDVGQVGQGIEKNLTGVGAFIDRGDVDGLLHIEEMRYVRGPQPSEIGKIGKDVEVKDLD